MTSVDDLKGIERLSPGAREFVLECQRLGIGCISDREEGRIYFHPREKVTEGLLERARQYGRELMDLIDANRTK